MELGDTCGAGHLVAGSNVKVATKGRERKYITCRQCSNDRTRDSRARIRAGRDAEREKAGLPPISRGRPAATIHWEETVGWFDDEGRACVTVQAVEYERANDDIFRLAARRRLTKWMRDHGIAVPTERGWWESFGEQELDWATDLPMTLSARTVDPVVEVRLAA